MKVAIVHFWLVQMCGAENVLEALCEMFPQAEIFTHVYVPEAVSETIRKHKVHTTFIHKLPKAKKLYQSYLPLMPLALQQLDLREYDLVISSESGPAKGVVVAPTALHICYCHSPMRYVWDMYPDYLASAGRFKRLLMPPLIHYLRMWDYFTAGGVDQFVANSNYVASRIQRYYRRSSEVIAPPVDTDNFKPRDDVEDFYLIFGRLVPYKRPDLAVSAFNETGRKLIVIGEGELGASLKKQAKDNIVFMGRQSSEVVREYLAKCKALIFPGLEDFGIVPVEAIASGRPVIAYGRGGALDTVIDGETGVFFYQQTTESLNDAIKRFEQDYKNFDPATITKHANKFSKDQFKDKFMNLVNRTLDEQKN